MNLGCGPIPGEGVPRSPRLLRERALHAAGDEIAAAVTRSRPAIPLGERQSASVRMTNKFLKPDLKPKGPF
jgi:hypothetical protein